MQHGKWPNFGLRHLAVVFLLAAVSLTVFRLGDAHLESRIEAVTDRVATARSEIDAVQRRTAAHTCRIGVCLHAVCPAPAGIRPPGNGCRWRSSELAKLQTIQNDVRALRSALAGAVHDRIVYRTRGLALLIPAAVVIAGIIPLGWLISRSRRGVDSTL